MNRKTHVTIAALVASTLGGVFWVQHRADASSTPNYRLGKVELGDIRSTVSATGTVGAVRTVEVGTQVSGQISAVYVDFNAQVKKGQLIARIDPVLQQQAVQDAQAGVARAEAPLTQTKLEYERSLKLHDQKIVTDAEFNAAQSSYAIARANLTSARISLDRARQNLAYTNIYSPIEGVVVERAIDVGQTVAASLSSPKLFVIANDLSQMEILASVDESDIGKIRPGQAVTFTVQSYQGQQFTGSVKQVRLNATTVNNVVSYTAIVSVANTDGKLLPGMTATVKFVTGSAEQVLTVPTAALRFTPAAGTASTTTAAPTRPAGAQNGAPSGAAVGAPRARTGTRTSGTIWTVDAAGVLVKHDVRVGLTDGTRAQVMGKDIAAGAAIVIGTTEPGAATPAAAVNPLAPTPTRAGGRGGPPSPF